MKPAFNFAEKEAWARGLSYAAIHYTMRDAAEAIRAWPDGENANYYQDEINVLSDELRRRRTAQR